MYNMGPSPILPWPPFAYDSNSIVIPAISAMPKIKAANCFTDSFGHCSCSRSGNTVTRAMCRNPPAVNGMIQDVLASNAEVTLDPKIATTAPNRPAVAVNNCALAASQRLNPDLSRIAKSPNSCGISCTERRIRVN